MSPSSAQIFHAVRYECQPWGGRPPLNELHSDVSSTASTYVMEDSDNDHGDKAYWDRSAPMKVEPSAFLGTGMLPSSICGPPPGLERTPYAATACEEQLCNFGMPEPVAWRSCSSSASICEPTLGLEGTPDATTACEEQLCDSGMPAWVAWGSCPEPATLSHMYRACPIQGEPAELQCQEQRESAQQGQTASMVLTENQMRQHQRFVCEIFFPGYNSEHHADFELVPRLIGRRAANVKEIATAGARVAIIGEGSSAVPACGRKSGECGHNNSLKDGTNSEMPLQMVLSSASEQSLQAALYTAQKQLENLEKHFSCFCRKTNKRKKGSSSHSAPNKSLLPLWKLGTCKDLLSKAPVQQTST